MDVVGRLVPGVLGDEDATQDDSFSSDGLLEYPQWTKPAEFRGWVVPEVMQTGNLAEQLKWKREQSLIRTLMWRPDLLEKVELSDQDRIFLKRYLEGTTHDNDAELNE
jgi:tRNA (guanine37-N1)-methyltransferase